MRRHWAVLGIVVAVGMGCRSAAPVPDARAGVAPPAVSATPTPVPLSEALRWTRNAAEHRAVFLQVYRQATAHVEREASRRAAGSWAVVLDADETVIGNSLYQLERARAGLGYDPESWRAWTARREATALPGAAAFLARVRELGGRIVIVTNRTATECPDTEANFRALELPFDAMLCKPDGGGSDKNPRFEAVAQGTTGTGLPPLEVVAFVGDNIQDFPGLSQAIRDQGDEAFAPFGARFFVLPNPIYGSWK